MAETKLKVNKVKTKYGDKISNDINHKIGKIISEGNEVLDQLQDLRVISLSPALDDKLGGGIREGTVCVISGPPKTGKSVTALSFAAHCQKYYDKNIYYFDTEGRLSKMHLEQIKDLDITKNFMVVGPTPEQLEISAEMYLNTAERLVRSVPNLVLIVDSTSNMLPAEELAGDIRGGIRAGLPKLLGQFLKRTSGDVPRSGAIIIFITHKIANTGARGPMAPKTVSDGGNQLQYQASTILDIGGKSYWKQGDEEVGQQIYWNIKTASAGGKPGSSAEGWLRWGVGVDKNKEIVHLASELGLIESKGAWYTIRLCIDNKDKAPIKKVIKRNNVDVDDDEAVEKLFKFQGILNLVKWMDDNPEVGEELYNEVQSIPL